MKYSAALLLLVSQVSAKKGYYGNAKERMAALHDRALFLQEERQLATCTQAEEYYDCANWNKVPAFGSCAAAEECIETDGEDGRRALRALKNNNKGNDDADASCWPSNPNCCDFGYEYGLKIDQSDCSTSGDDFCLKNGDSGASRGSVNIKCPSEMTVQWDGDIMFEAAFRKNANRMYKDDNDLVCGADTDAGKSSGSITGTHHATSHFDLCWNANSPDDKDDEADENDDEADENDDEPDENDDEPDDNDDEPDDNDDEPDDNDDEPDDNDDEPDEEECVEF